MNATKCVHARHGTQRRNASSLLWIGAVVASLPFVQENPTQVEPQRSQEQAANVHVEQPSAAARSVPDWRRILCTVDLTPGGYFLNPLGKGTRGFLWRDPSAGARGHRVLRVERNAGRRPFPSDHIRFRKEGSRKAQQDRFRSAAEKWLMPCVKQLHFNSDLVIIGWGIHKSRWDDCVAIRTRLFGSLRVLS